MADTVLVKLRDLYLAYHQGDYALQHILTDPDAQVVQHNTPVPCQPIDIEEFWRGSNRHPLNLVFAHFWRQGLDFAFIDVGANIGIVSVQAHRFFRGAGRRNPIYAFEPGSAFDCLQATIAANGCEAEAKRLAVTDHCGEIVFHEIEGNSSGGSLLKGVGERAPVQLCPISVECTTIDKFVAERGITTNLICKVDTEGADFLVIDGMRQSIANRLVPIFFEFTPWLVEKYADPAERLAELAQDFYLLDCSGVGLWPISGVPGFIRWLRAKRADAYTDILALPHRMPGLREFLARAVVLPK